MDRCSGPFIGRSLSGRTPGGRVSKGARGSAKQRESAGVKESAGEKESVESARCEGWGRGFITRPGLSSDWCPRAPCQLLIGRRGLRVGS